MLESSQPAAQVQAAQAALKSSASLTSGSSVSLDTTALLAQALGDACQCELLRADVVWRPVRLDHPLCSAQTALVVGPCGCATDTGAGDLYGDSLGRVRIRFHWAGSVDKSWIFGATAVHEVASVVDFLHFLFPCLVDHEYQTGLNPFSSTYFDLVPQGVSRPKAEFGGIQLTSC